MSRQKFPVLLLAIVLLTASATFSKSELGQQASTSDTTSITITDVSIPIGNDIELHGRLYRPKPINQSRPTIFVLTPYTVGQYNGHAFGKYFAKKGYSFLNVDTRGRGGSNGTFDPLFQDGSDGVKVVQWIEQQPWNNGKVVMRGGSYLGMVQWQTLAENSNVVQTVIPTASVYPGWDAPNPQGIFQSYTARWLGLIQGKAHQENRFADSPYWTGKYLELHKSGRAFSELDEATGLSLHMAEVFQEWIKHPHLDGYWQAASPKPSDYQEFDLPILTITGHFDADQLGALRYYRRHMKFGPEEGKQQHYLLIGPWNHWGTRVPAKELNGLTFSDNAVLNINRLHHEWYQWVLQDGAKPSALKDRVTYYVTGANKWRSAPSLEAVSDTTRELYLQSPDKNPQDPFDAGQLTTKKPTEEDLDKYIYDPRQTADIVTQQHIEGNFTSSGAAFLNGPKLIYHSSPVEESFELSGQMQLDAWIELDVPDTDLAAWVYEIRPTGKTIYLGDTKLRARHRNGVDTNSTVKPGAVERYQFDRFYWTSRQIQKGSRIRLVIAPLNDPDWQKNYNSGKPPMQETIEDAKTATVKLHIGPNYPSKLILPIRSN